MTDVYYVSGDKPVIVNICRMTKEYLSEQPFRNFLESMYFKRYLQWKWLERFVNAGDFNTINLFDVL